MLLAKKCGRQSRDGGVGVGSLFAPDMASSLIMTTITNDGDDCLIVPDSVSTS